MKTIKKLTKAEQRKVLHMEVDYHLMSLHDAVQANDKAEVNRQKVILAKKSKELRELV
jgi:hypothetical protein